jgi:hypothetical protein
MSKWAQRGRNHSLAARPRRHPLMGGVAAMTKAARDAVAEVSRQWLGQTAARWWIGHEQESISKVIEDAVKVKLIAAAKSGNNGHNR